jgi:hypothetical protein
MRQALHIFQKDVRYLWREIGLLASLAATFARMTTDWAETLLIIAAAYLIARLIHAEPIPGDHQFWITRPYRWRSLLAAKLLFIVAFVNLPIFLAQLYLLNVSGFSLVSNWPGLLWSQVLTFLAVWLPISALAAVTSGIVPFVFSVLVLVAAGFIAEMRMIGRSGMPWPVGVEWVRNSAAVVAVVAVTLSILYSQYKNRGTLLSRVLGLAAVVLAATLYFYLPLSWAMRLQSRLSREPIDSSSVRVVLDRSAERHFPSPNLNPGKMPIDLPMMASGIPDGVNLQVDSLTLTFRGEDGRMWKTNFASTNRQSDGPGTAVFDVPLLIDPAFFNEEQDKEVTLRVSFYLTAFGNSRAKTIPLQREPADVMDGLQCYLDRRVMFNYYTCRSAFRWPARLVYVSEGSAVSALGQLMSYSPFPAGINIDNAIESRSTSQVSTSASQITISVEEPLAHFRRDVDIGNVRLGEFAAVMK